MRRRLSFLAVLVVVLSASAAPVVAQQPTVRAALFFSSSCGHCEYVINDLLLPVWFPEYGGEPDWSSAGYEGENPSFYLATNGTLEILFVNTSTQGGSEFFVSSSEELGLSYRGVPLLVVGERYLMGSGDIPDLFPGIIEEGLASGGIDWPDLVGIQEILAALAGGSSTTTVPETTTIAPNPGSTTVPGTTSTVPSGTTTTDPVTTTTGGIPSISGESPWDRFRQDPVGNSLSVAVLVLMVLSLGAVVWLVRWREGEGERGDLLVPLLALAGLAVAVYLASVEMSGSQAVCGPVGDCNTVQQSEWAEVFGIHIGVIGVGGYAVVLAVWALARLVARPLADWARVALFAGAAGGTGFSIYLTFLEPFVIGATCLWCLSSAVIVTALMWVTAGPGVAAWERLRAGD